MHLPKTLQCAYVAPVTQITDEHPGFASEAVLAPRALSPQSQGHRSGICRLTLLTRRRHWDEISPE